MRGKQERKQNKTVVKSDKISTFKNLDDKKKKTLLKKVTKYILFLLLVN